MSLLTFGRQGDRRWDDPTAIPQDLAPTAPPATLAGKLAQAAIDRSGALLYYVSANPLTRAHLNYAQLAMREGGYRRVLLLIAGQPPHKAQRDDFLPAHWRLRLARLGLQGESSPESARLRIWNLDTLASRLRKGGTAYTQTKNGGDSLLAKMIKALPKGVRLPVLVGRDALEGDGLNLRGIPPSILPHLLIVQGVPPGETPIESVNAGGRRIALATLPFLRQGEGVHSQDVRVQARNGNPFPRDSVNAAQADEIRRNRLYGAPHPRSFPPEDIQ